jgi:3alpha(or 20beta)-hydroxysteroid dehydrogenase
MKLPLSGAGQFNSSFACNTQMMRSLESGSGASQEDIALSIPLGRYAEGEDIANMALFLASEKSGFVTGSQFRVDGGMLS